MFAVTVENVLSVVAVALLIAALVAFPYLLSRKRAGFRKKLDDERNRGESDRGRTR